MNRKLKAKIIERFGTQSDFAAAIGLQDALVSRVIRGRRKLSPEQEKKWAEALNTSPVGIFSK